MKRLAITSAVLVLAAMVCRRAAASDLVEVSAGGSRAQVLGAILDESWEKGVTIEYEAEGEKKQRTIPLDAVTKVQRGELPPNLSLGLQKIRSQDYEEALDLLRQFYTEARQSGPPWALPYALYSAGEAAGLQAKYAADPEEKSKAYNSAQNAWGMLIKDFPAHRFVPEAMLGRGEMLMWLKQYDEAASLFRQIQETAFPERVKAAGQVWNGRMLIEQRKVDEGIAALQKARQQWMDKYPDLGYKAMLCETYGWQAKGTVEDRRKAEDMFETVGLQSPDQEDRSEAFNSRGISLKGRGDRREALLSFLRVVVLHGDVRQEHQRALYEAALLSKEVYGNDKRARELQKTLMIRYPNSYWARKLEKEL